MRRAGHGLLLGVLGLLLNRGVLAKRGCQAVEYRESLALGVALCTPVSAATLRLEAFPFVLVAAPGKTFEVFLGIKPLRADIVDFAITPSYTGANCACLDPKGTQQPR